MLQGNSRTMDQFGLINTGFRLTSGSCQRFVQLILVLRATTTINNYAFNIYWNSEQIRWLDFTVIPELQGDLCSSFVIVIGIGLALIYGMSMFDCLYWILQVRKHACENNLCLRRMWCTVPNVLVLGVTAMSVVNACWFFLFVSQVWTHQLGLLFRVLHVVPTFFVIYYTVFIGVLLCDTNVVKSMLFPHQYQRDVRTHQGANAVLIVYAITNVLVAISENQGGPNVTLATKYVAIFVAFEMVSRGYLIYQLGKRAAIPSMPVTRNATELAENKNHSAELAEARDLNYILAEPLNNENIASIPIELESNSDRSSLSSYKGSEFFTQSIKNSELLDSDYVGQSMEQVELELYNESKRLLSDESTTRRFYEQASVKTGVIELA